MNLLTVRVTPRASKNAIQVADDGSVKVYVSAPPADGEANDAVIKILAKALGAAPSTFKVAKGHKSREMAIDLGSLDQNEAITRLKNAEQSRS